MLFHSSLRKELSRSFGATLVVLATIVMTMMLIRTLGLASRGSVNPSEVFLVMAYTVLGYMPTILSLSLFISIVGTLSRMYRDSEMVIWFSSGRGLADFALPLFRFAWPVLLLIAVFALVGWPWANSQTQGMREQYQRRGDIERVSPGEFRESAGRNRVFFIDKDTPDGATATNVFISSIERNMQIITSARSGRMEDIGEARYLMLSNGQRVSRTLDGLELKISEFDTYGAKVGGDEGLDGHEPGAHPHHVDPAAGTEYGQSRRTGLAHRHDARGHQFRAAGADPDECESARGPQRQSALRVVRFRPLLQHAQSRPELGGLRPLQHGRLHAGAARRRAAARPALACQATLQLGPPAPAARNASPRVKTIRRLIYVEVLKAVAFVTLGFLSLFFFFDFVDELQSIGKPGAAPTGPPRPWSS